MNEEVSCIFCRSDFPDSYQLVSDSPKYWLFILNKNPQCDYHSMIVLKKQWMEKGHISQLDDDNLCDEALVELARLLKKAFSSIKSSDSEIDNVFLVSLNVGQGTRHLHFHLVPKRKGEKIKTPHKPEEDGGGMFFLARREIIADAYSEFLESITEDSELTNKIKGCIREKVEKNADTLKTNFEWMEI